jgi:hypothetical protein
VAYDPYQQQPGYSDPYQQQPGYSDPYQQQPGGYTDPSTGDVREGYGPGGDGANVSNQAKDCMMCAGMEAGCAVACAAVNYATGGAAAMGCLACLGKPFCTACCMCAETRYCGVCGKL